jgi:hypothetical protein
MKIIPTYAIVISMAAFLPLKAQFTWTNVEKEVSFRYGFTQQENTLIPVEVMTRNNQFTSQFAPITSENTATFNPSYTRMYGLDFGLRFLFTKHFFSKINLGVNEQFFGYSQSYEDESVGTVDINTRVKYFGIPFTMGSGFSLPFDWDDKGNVGAVNLFLSGFMTPLISPTGTSGIDVFTREPLDNGFTYSRESDPIIDGIGSNRMADITGIYGGVISLSVEFNEVTFTIDYRRFSGFGVLNANPDNRSFFDSGERGDWFGHSIDIGFSFRFY